ncbi:VOC family protein [Leifsonia sp. A12D58]|uniref:VOC family protein n=1 Tax=Leifsonia sp. A12D58 TaxID=3397674 RepID=UPI0039E12EC8
MTTQELGFVHGFSGFAVTDIDAAKTFYRDVLGLEVVDRMMGLIGIRLPGGSEVLVYPKPDLVPANYTILNLETDDIDKSVDALIARGVEFLRYEGFEQDEKGIARGNGPSIAWFADPSGNLFSVLQDNVAE